MNGDLPAECRLVERVKERDKIGVWGFGSVSRDVVLSLVDEGLGKEVVFYGRPKPDYPNRAGAWIEDLKANTLRRPRTLELQVEPGWSIERELFHELEVDEAQHVRLPQREVFLFELRRK